MTHAPISICHGWSCPLVTKCGVSDFNIPGDLHGWVRHFQSPYVGENCPYFKPLAEAAWGEGADVPTMD